ncbi:PRP3-domain-containing protein [Lichtheimia hyalospora FSU 10163]|nr:PRP3-domain-containing protein [Lichtheimia hyalospora FSU 10163]
MPDPQETAALVAAKRAEVLAKLAKFQKGGPATPSSSSQRSASPSTTTTPPSGSRTNSPAPPSTRYDSGSPSEGGSPGSIDAIQRRIAEAKARLANTKSSGITPRATVNGIYVQDGSGRIGSAQLSKDSAGGIDLFGMLESIPKREVATAKANARATTKKEAKPLKIDLLKGAKDKSVNPYLEDLGVKSAKPIRKPRALRFVEPGKFVEQANKERAKIQMEKLKQSIAENVKKAGVQVEMDISDKALKREPPPLVEWWDAPFLPNKTYEDMNESPVNPDELNQLITIYVHHPIPIKPPNEANGPPTSRSLMLTKKEQKKLRRQRRQELQKEKQDKIRLGLLPPDPPKVKISNLMQVLGNEAIQDPTKIEAKVRKEMEQRQKQHELANAQRKLTPEEKKAKTMNKLNEDKKMSNEVAVFKVVNCAHPKLRYKIEVNAQQYQLTGMVIINPKCHLVIVEGGPKSMKAYKKLMLRRIDWNDMPPPKHGELPPQARMEPNQENKCFLVWEGQVKTKTFRKFTWRKFESEKMARDQLSKWHVEHYWDAAVMASNEELAARQPEL